MSGTPIKNHAGEYFTILNLVAPKRFPHYQTYVDKYCDSYNSGWSQKVGGLRDAKRFKEDTEDIIIRRTKDQVLKDLPSLDRKFFHVDLDPKLNKAYAAALKELEELFYKDDMSSFERGSAQIAIMSRLRHITGISKIDECIDFVTEFLISCNRKITIFTHHKDVLDILVDKLNMWLSDGGYSEALSLHSGLSSDRRAAVVERFKDPAYRIMVASTLAAGEGLNLQFCSDAILLERQWNPPNEEQTEARFHRFGQKNNVSVTYMIAIGTIDEYFTELVEKKRAIVSSAMDGKEMQWDQNSLMKELAETLLTKGRERWRL
jgi:SNF2 family DNA or RNA helicase